MLALTRKIDQRIQIGSDICITILHVRGKQVRIGIEAPRQVKVVRAELSDDDGAGLAISLSELARPGGRQQCRREAGRGDAAGRSPPPRFAESGRARLQLGPTAVGRQTACRRAPHAAPVAVA